MIDSGLAGQNRPGPLEGIRVLEVAVFHAGPGAGAILGDLGAEVIKIEADTGDPLRDWTKLGANRFALPNGSNLLFELSNRNKKAICLDVRSEKGREILFDLVKSADVFLTNLRKSTKEKLGIDYATLSKINPKIIHANVSGYGPEGPVSDLGAYDPMGQARSGMMFVTGNQEPVLIQIAVLDQATCISASHAIMTALFARERHGIGQEVHVSLYSTALWLLHVNLMSTSSGLLDPNIKWDRTKNSPVRNSFCCEDGKWIVGVHHPEERFWPRVCDAIGRPDLKSDPRFAEYDSRIENGEELIALFDAVFASKPADEWIEELTRHGLMFSPVQTLKEVLEDPQALENAYVVDFDHPDYGNVKIPGYPAHFSEYSAGAQSLAPKLGESTDLVLRELGLSNERIQELRSEGVVK
jgi:crotonobetainyl-CoA:carnitine CoA-transferase CaiB-like acyl-CoA transferase